MSTEALAKRATRRKERSPQSGIKSEVSDSIRVNRSLLTTNTDGHVDILRSVREQSGSRSADGKAHKVNAKYLTECRYAINGIYRLVR